MNTLRNTPLLNTILMAALGLTLPAACGDDGASETETGTVGDTEGEGSGDCATDEDFFERDVWTPMLSMTCISCHSDTGAAKGTRLVLQSPDMPGYLDYNMEVLSILAQEEVDGTSILLLKPSGQHPDGHVGGMPVQMGTDQYANLEEFVARATGTFSCENAGPGCEEIGAGPRTIRRLSHPEFDHTMVDLLGVSGDLGELATSFAPDNVVDGYTNNADALLVSPLLADQYRVAGEALADYVVMGKAQFLPCDPVADGEEACAEEFVRTFGARAFRRPLTDKEVGRYTGLWSDVAAEDGFDEGMKWATAALLQSPGFLYRTELGTDGDGDGVYELTPHEVASELSYLIVGTMPDETLMAAADDGSILEEDVLVSEATRLLANTDLSARTLDRFVDEWLGLTLLPIVTRDPDLYPELTPEIRAAMTGEIHRVVGEVFANGGTMADLLTTDFTHVTDALAAYYGLPAGEGEADAEGYRRVALNGDTYGGLLTQGALMTTHAKPTSSSPIHRGVVVRERLLCQELPPPPPSLDTSPPPVDPNQSTRDRYVQHSAEPACAGCHDRIDPIGFGFEHFDAIGRYRTMDGPHAVDASGEILQTQETDAAFNGAIELSAALAASGEVEACYAHQWLQYSLGAKPSGELSCVEDEVVAAFTEGGGQLDALLMALVRSRHFLIRGGAGGGGGDTGGDPTSTSGDPTSTSGDPTSTSGDPTSTTTGGSGGETGDTSPGIDVEIVVDSMWEAGECDSVFIHNLTNDPIVWQVDMTLPGNLQNHWNAQVSLDGLDALWTGEDYNATVEGMGTVSFGFCVNY